MEVARRKNKFTCYFCNQTIENDTEMGHTAVCGSVLISCPNKCGSYISRMDMKKHQRECLNRMSQSMQKLPTSNEMSLPYETSTTPLSTVSLERHMNGYTQSLPNHHNEIRKLSQKIVSLEQKLLYNNQSLQNTLQKQNQDSSKNVYVQQQGLEIEKLKYQSKTMFEWKKNLESHLDGIKQSVAAAQNAKRDMELRFMSLQEKMAFLEKLHHDFNYLKEVVFKDQSDKRQAQSILEQDVRNFKNHYAQEAASFASVLNDHTYTIDMIKSDIEDINKSTEETKNKITNMIFDLKAASQIASEASERVEILERDFSETRKEIGQMKLDLEILEGLVSFNDVNVKPGRLLWKVTDVGAKLERAKDFGTVVKSQVFFTHEYGYKIRILMYINGLKKWKDRYCLLCIHVLKGEYDMLLKWPCNLEGNVTLRNVENLEQGKQFTKTITAKKEYGDEEEDEPQESSSTYIFIPHNTLMSKQYLRDDTFFLDVKILKSNKLETSL